MHRNQWAPETILGNKYKIKRILEQGILGVAYEIEHFEWEGSLKLKRFLSDYFTNHTQGQHLKHAIDRWIALPSYPNLVNAYYWETFEGELCLVMEYVEGVNGRHFLLQSGLRERIDILIQLGHALQRAHRNRLIHGHLTPENMLITPGNVLLLGDFCGLAFHFEKFEPEKWRPDPDECMGYDFRQYGAIARETITSWEGWSQSPGQETEANTLQEIKEWMERVPERSDSFEAQIGRLKEIYESMAPGAYRNNGILPARIEVDHRAKHAFSYLEQGKKEEAVYLWNLAGENTPLSVYALWNWYLYNLRQGNVSLDVLIDALEQSTVMAPSRLVLAQAELSLEFGCHIHEMIEKVNTYAGSFEENSEWKRIRGDLFCRVRAFDKALALFSSLVESKDKESDDWYRLAVTHFNMGNLERAMVSCRKGLEEFPSHLLLSLLESALLYLQGKNAESRERFEKMAEKYQDIFWGLYHLGEFYAGRGIYERETSPEDRQKARDYYEKLLRLNSSLITAVKGYHSCGGTSIPAIGNYPVPIVGWSEIRQFSDHANMVTAVAVSPEGKWAVSGDCEGDLFLWDIQSGSCVAHLDGHYKHISCVAISPDGGMVASGSWDKTVRIWMSPSGDCIHCLQGHQDKISSLDMTPDGAYLISGSWDGIARIWRTATGECISQVENDGLWITDVAISPDGSMAITCDENEQMHLWEVSTRNILSSFHGSNVIVNQAFTMAVSTGYDGLQIWDISTGKQKETIPTQGKESCLAISRDETILLTRNEDDVMTLWDLVDKRRIAVLHSEEALCADMTEDGKYIVSGSNNLLYLWEDISQRPFPLFRYSRYLSSSERSCKNPDMIEEFVRKGERAFFAGRYEEAFKAYQTVLKIPGYEDVEIVKANLHRCVAAGNLPIKKVKEIVFLREIPSFFGPTALALSRDGQTGLMASFDEPIRQWNLKSGYLAHQFSGHFRIISALTISGPGHLALSGSWDGTAILWDLDQPWVHKIVHLNEPVSSVSMDDSSSHGLVGTRSGRVVFFDFSTLQERVLQTSSRSVSHTLLRGPYAIFAWEDGEIEVWDIEKNERIGQYRPHGRFITAMDLDSQTKYLLSASRNGSICCSRLESGESVRIFDTEGEEIRKIGWTEGGCFITVSRSSSLKVWSMDEEKHIANRYLHDGLLDTAAISRDGRYVFTADESKEAIVWEIKWE